MSSLDVKGEGDDGEEAGQSNRTNRTGNTRLRLLSNRNAVRLAQLHASNGGIMMRDGRTCTTEVMTSSRRGEAWDARAVMACPTMGSSM